MTIENGMHSNGSKKKSEHAFDSTFTYIHNEYMVYAKVML